MCGRFVLYSSSATVAVTFSLDNELELTQARYNIAPTQDIVIVRQDGEGRLGEMARWGLIPSWSKEIGKCSTINARAETVSEKPMFRDPFRHHRCLIPANGFFEWELVNGKQPWYIRLADSELFAFAGLFDHWLSPGGEEIQSATIIVCDASPDIITIHDRMPVILKPEDWAKWLDPTLSDPEALMPFLKPTNKGEVVLWKVSREVNSSRNEGPGLIENITN